AASPGRAPRGQAENTPRGERRRRYSITKSPGGAGASSRPGGKEKAPAMPGPLNSCLGRAASTLGAAAAKPSPNPGHVKAPLAHCLRRTVNASYTLRNKVKRVLTLMDS